MSVTEIDLKGEVAQVQRELMLFRQECLPAFLGAPIQECLTDGMSERLRHHIVAVAGRLSEWQGTEARLAEALPLGPLAPDAFSLNRADFKPFLFQSATPAYTFREGRILWRIELFMHLDLADALRGWQPFCGMSEDIPREDMLSRLPQIKQWFLGLPVDDDRLGNALCAVLPAVADADPAFARLVLNRDTWRALECPGPSTVVAKRLRCLDSYWFSSILNNALLHVLGGLANNHFGAIRDYLDHPNLRGGYTHLMPHYLFAVLFEKVAALRRLSQERPDLWE